MRKTSMPVVLLFGLLATACGGDDDGGDGGDDGPLFQPEPECEGEAVEALMGRHSMVLSSLEIAGANDGFDLDGDGEPDNQLAVLGALAEDAIADGFEDFELVLPMEFFDLDEPGVDECVKFAVYVGAYRLDEDGDDAETAGERGDCDDTDPSVYPGAEEVPGNGLDDDCDGLADEVATEVETDGGVEVVEMPSDDESDADGDGVSLAAGDCDDTRAGVAPGLEEVCGDGLDNDCAGGADWSPGAEPACSPYDAELDPIAVDPLSLDEQGDPAIVFLSGEVVEEDGVLRVRGGPAFFSLILPIDDDVSLDLRLTGATLEGDLTQTPGGWALTNGRLGGVIDVVTADGLRGIEVEQINLRAEDSLLDAIFANALGALLGLPLLGDSAGVAAGCHTPDIDVDRDGLEAFCDETDDAEQIVDLCVDGDGTPIRDEGSGASVTHCTEARDEDGDLRFVDGISAMLHFETVPAVLSAPR